MNKIAGKRILITGGTGSLGKALVKRLFSVPDSKLIDITVFSRDELKQSQLRAQYPNEQRLKFVIGDVRDSKAVIKALQKIDIVFNTAAMKRVETCQRFPVEAVKTNILGTINIVEAIIIYRLPIDAVVGVSSDKGCHPVNVYGKTKALQEDILLAANEDCPQTRFVSACYGNVMASRGSVIPVFQEQIADGGPLTIHDATMTRFLISIEKAVDTLLATLESAQRGEIYVPIIGSATVADIATVLIDGRNIEQVNVGRGTGEKMNEILIDEVEAFRTVERNGYYVVTPVEQKDSAVQGEYNSKDHVMNRVRLKQVFRRAGLM